MNLSNITSVFLFCILATPLLSQINPDYKTLEVNNIRTGLNSNGLLFYNESDNGSFQVPNDEEGDNPCALNAGNLIIIGVDEAENIKGSIGMYETQWQSGFLDIETGLPFTSPKMNQNRVWSITKIEIEEHRQRIADCDENYEIPIDILEWPATGNVYYDGQMNQRAAPFFDNNENEVYEPLLGDFPIVGYDRIGAIPDQLLFAVTNDFGDMHFGGQLYPNLEVFTMLYAYKSDELDALNNSVFQRHYITNRGVNDLQNTSIGFWYDTALGCPEDDRIGCDTLQRAMYVYNGDPIDGDQSNGCIDDSVQSYPSSSVLVTKLLTYIAFIDLDFGSFIGWGTSGEATPDNNQIDLTIEGIYNLVQGRWSDDTPITLADTGFNPDSLDLEETKFLFQGDPKDLDAWVSPSDDYQVMMNLSQFRLPPGVSFHFEVVHTFAHSDTLDHLEIIDKGLADADSAQYYLFEYEHDYPTFPIDINKAIIYPNPTSGQITVETEGDLDTYELYTTDGRFIESGWVPRSGSLFFDKPRGVFNLVLRFGDDTIQTERIVILDR